MKKIMETDKKAVRFWLYESAAYGPAGAFFTAVDVGGLALVWGGLFYTLTSNRGLSIDKNLATEICKSTILGAGAYYVGCKTATKFFHLIPLAGTLAAMGISALTNIVFTYRFALSLSEALETDESKRNDWKNISNRILSSFVGNGAKSDVADICDIMLNPKYSNINLSDAKDTVVSGAKRFGNWIKDIWNG